mgnify:CR=1 FL=1
MVKAKNKLQALSINEEVGDIATHWLKSGSAFRPSEDLLILNEFGKKITISRIADMLYLSLIHI